MAPQRILIYAINGKGMGHLNRTLVLAQAARAAVPETQILFAVASPLFWLVRESGFAVLKVPDRNHALGFHIGKESRSQHLNAVFEPIFELFRPSAFVIDLNINARLFETARKNGATVALVLRKQRSSIMASTERDSAIDFVDRFLVPHPDEEFSFGEIPSSWRSRARRLGPVVRSLQPARVAETRARYSESNRPLVVVTIGGGGFPESYRTLVAAEQAAGSSPDLDWVLIYGPYYPGTIPPSSGNVQRVKFEPNLLELCTASDIVVCNAGYNTIRELAVSGTPAVVIPLDGTGADDQRERAAMLASHGTAIVAKADGAEVLARVRLTLEASVPLRRSPEPGEPAEQLGERFLQALLE